jgi:hypothetical protein
MGETRVDLQHLLEDLRDAYPGAIEETIVTEIVANSLDSGARTIALTADPNASVLTVVDDGSGMQRRELRRYHDIAATTKTRGRGIGFAGVGIKLGLLVCDEVVTETRRGKVHVATSWRLTSKRRAPWNWLKAPPGLVGERGTAVRLTVQNAFSPLVDSGYIEASLRQHYQSLLDPFFDEFLSHQYEGGVRLLLNGRELDKRPWVAGETARISVRLPRKRKPSAVGYLVRDDVALPEDRRGIAISTFGKVIKRGWDWLGVTPDAPELVGGVIEAPGLAECLTLSKGDFIRSGQLGAIYLAYRKAIQEAMTRQLADWGDLRGRREKDRRRAAGPVERDLESVLLDLADEFPLLNALVERRAGGQRTLPTGVAADRAAESAGAGAGAPASVHATGQEETSEAGGPAEPEAEDEESEATGPETSSTVLEPPTAKKGRRRPARYALRIEFEQRPESAELARLVEATVWVNEAHPAYRRASGSRAAAYHVALSAAMALAPLAAEAVHQHEFITAFLTRWGNADLAVKRGRRKRR